MVIDFGGHLASRGLGEDNPMVRGYKDLSAKGDIAEASRNLFAYLRWSEVYGGEGGGADQLWVADVGRIKEGSEGVGGIEDRVFRAASGKRKEL